MSDGVFAIALTSHVLSISAPALPSGHHGELGRRLLDREPEVRSWAISFQRAACERRDEFASRDPSQQAINSMGVPVDGRASASNG